MSEHESQAEAGRVEPLVSCRDAIDAQIRKDKADDFGNNYFSIDELPLTQAQKECVLEWLARKLWVIYEESSGEPDYYGKSYDPLVIEGDTAHSYVFNLWDGGRHHVFENLKQLEDGLIKETIENLQGLIRAKAIGI